MGRVEKVLIVLFLSLMILTAFAQIALRNLFGIGLSSSEPLVRYLVLWVGFIGAALAAREGRHITIEVFALWAAGKGGRQLAVVPQVCSAVVCGLLTYAAVKFVIDDAQLGSRTFLDLPTWVPELIIPATFALMTLRFTLRSIQSFCAPAASQAPTHRL
jgi:TRAP-type C4-dicarboxylate transport system permease small subunit